MIYLDSAATTLQKPKSVAVASARAISTMASPGRGGHRPAMLAAETAYRCREEAAALFHVPDPEQVVFTFNATHGLNIAVKSLVSPGSRVVISGYEHNAVTRPLASIPQISIRVAQAPLFDAQAMLKAFRKEIEEGADTVICTHVSNVFGAILPIEQIAALCRERAIPFIIDASQSAGVLPLDFEALGADFVAMPGHKGLYGPQGTGLLLCRSTAAIPVLYGGTGSKSVSWEMPEFLPDRLEAGTHNIPGIAGLLEGIRYIGQTGTENIRKHESMLICSAAKGLMQIPGMQVFAAGDQREQSGVLSFRVNGVSCEDVGERLSRAGFALRAGLHCAPLAHRTGGTFDTGTVRASVSAFTTEAEIRQFVSTAASLFA